MPVESSENSVLIEDAALERLYEWVAANGGVFHCESRADTSTKVRGLYATKDITDSSEPIIQIPSKLIVSPYHVSRRKVAEWGDGHLTYDELFKATPRLFHPKFPHEPHDVIPGKMDNHLGEYFQLALFLIVERLKGDKSFYKPFLDYLPVRNDTLFTLDLNTPIAPHLPQTSMLSELQNEKDDLFRWLAYDREVNRKAQERFNEYINDSFAQI